MPHTRTFRQARLALRGLVALAVVGLASCGSDDNARHKVYPVKGKVLVNGQPAHEAQVTLNRTFAEKNPVAPSAMTDQNGDFQVTSYQFGDGAPEGEYVVTITWRERSGITKQDFDGPDRLGGAYATQDKTKGMPGFVVKVDKKPTELPPFELKQSAEAKRRAEEAKKRPVLGQGPLGSAGDK